MQLGTRCFSDAGVQLPTSRTRPVAERAHGLQERRKTKQIMRSPIS